MYSLSTPHSHQNLSIFPLKGTLMQKSLSIFVLILKQFPENFAFLIQRILELFTREVSKCLKK